MMNEIDAGLIFRSANARPLDKSRVAQLADSIREVGLINPVCVRRVTRHNGTKPIEAFDIVAGHHRYEALVSLKAESIKCIILDCDDLHAELAEIDENLIRTPLTPAQEAEAIFRRKAIYEELHPETKAPHLGGAFRGNQHKKEVSDNLSGTSFTTDAAAKTGKDERTIRRAAARGEALGDDLHEIAGTSLDKGAELDALAKMGPEERKPLIERAKAGERVTARKEPKLAADPLDDVMASERQVARLMDAWNAAGPEARQEFLLRIDGPVFDRGAAE